MEKKLFSALITTLIAINIILVISIATSVIAAPPARGDIDVNSNPSGASIFLDGASKGTTPILIKRVSAGTHTILLTLSGYQDHSEQVNVLNGQTAIVSATLVPNSGPDVTPPTVSVSHSPASPAELDTVTVTSTASDTSGISQVRVYIDGSLAATCGSSPCSSNPQMYPVGAHAYYAEADDTNSNTGRDPFSGTYSFTISGQPLTLVRTTDTSIYSPPSPDPAGIVYLASSNRLLISDSEVNEVAIFEGKNLFYTSLSGSLLDTAATTVFSNEPTGVTVNPANGHIFVSDDNNRRVYEVDVGNDSLFGTSDDIVSSFSTNGYGNGDPEGLAFDTSRNELYIADGVDSRIYKVNPGPNGLFDALDDTITSFDTISLGVTDPEGIAYNDQSDTIFFVGFPHDIVVETTVGGSLVNVHDISAASAVKPAGMTFAPGSTNLSDNNLYIVDRNTDNNDFPNENDGLFYEFAFPSVGPQPPTANAGPDQTVSDAYGEGSVNVSVDGSGSFDSDGTIVSYEWSEGPVVLGNAVFLQTFFDLGNHLLTLKVVDNDGLEDNDTLLITVIGNQLPVPDAGDDQTVVDSDDDGFETVTLDGWGSSDDGFIATFTWSEGNTTIGTGAIINPSLSVGTHIVSLAVEDNLGLITSDLVSITVDPAPPPVTTIFSDDFESGFGNWVESNEFDWNIETPAETNVPGHASGNLVAHADNCDSFCELTTTPTIDLSGKSSATLSFWRYVDNSLGGPDYLKVEVYDGNSWNQIFYWSNGNGDDDTWHLETFDLSGYLINDFQLRFTSKERKASAETEIDDVLIEGN